MRYLTVVEKGILAPHTHFVRKDELPPLEKWSHWGLSALSDAARSAQHYELDREIRKELASRGLEVAHTFEHRRSDTMKSKDTVTILGHGDAR